MRARDAGHRHREALEVPVEGQRQFRDHLRFENAAGVGPIGLQRRALGRHRDLFRHLTDAQREINTNRRVDVDLDALARHLLESLQFGLHRVGAVRQARENVIAGLVGDALRLMFLPTSVAVTVAPGTAPPLESVTLPSSVPVTACAAAIDGMSMSTALAITASIGPRKLLDATCRLRRIRSSPPQIDPRASPRTPYAVARRVLMPCCSGGRAGGAP